MAKATKSQTSKLASKDVNKTATHPIQTWEWGEFRREWGNEVLHTKHGLLTVHRTLASIRRSGPFTGHRLAMFLKGPKPTKRMLDDLKKIGKENNLIFIKLEPNTKKSNRVIKLLRKEGVARGKTLFTPTSFWIDLTKSEDELLKSFHPKTRYNIRLAEKKGVKIEEDNSSKAFDKYIDLMRRTVAHQGFYAHNERYHRLMWKILKDVGVAHLLVAKHKGKIIAAWILFRWKNFLYYPYGASDERYRNLMANNLMMWEAIKFGKRHKLTTFDLWGREPGRGFTRFKEGYGPEVIEFLGTWDLIINKKLYYLYRVADSLRWLLLRTKSRFTKPSF